MREAKTLIFPLCPSSFAKATVDKPAYEPHFDISKFIIYAFYNITVRGARETGLRIDPLNLNWIMPA